MLDVITQGYIAAQLKIENLIKDQRGVVAIEYVALAIGLITVFAVVFGQNGEFKKALVGLINKLSVKMDLIGKP